MLLCWCTDANRPLNEHYLQGLLSNPSSSLSSLLRCPVFLLVSIHRQIDGPFQRLSHLLASSSVSVDLCHGSVRLSMAITCPRLPAIGCVFVIQKSSDLPYLGDLRTDPFWWITFHEIGNRCKSKICFDALHFIDTWFILDQVSFERHLVFATSKIFLAHDRTLVSLFLWFGCLHRRSRLHRSVSDSHQGISNDEILCIVSCLEFSAPCRCSDVRIIKITGSVSESHLVYV